METRTQRPVFVAGLERSGTSLLYALLTSHPNLAMTRRTNFWTHFYRQFGDLAVPENLDRCLATMQRYKRMVVLQPDYERIRREFLEGEPSYGRLFALLEAQQAELAGKPRWGDKSLHIERYAAPILQAFPEAKILHIIRDPRDRYASALRRWKVSRGGVGGGTAMWLSSLRRAERNLRRYPQGYLVLRYETLTAEPERTMRQVCDFIGEEYAPSMLAMTGAADLRDDGFNSSFGQITPGTIATSSIGRFRQVLSSRQVALMQLYAGPAMLRWQYALEPVRLTTGQWLRFGCLDWPLNTARMAAWYATETIQDWVGRKLPAYRIVAAPELGQSLPSSRP